MQKRALRRSKEMMKARIKADDDKQQKEEFQATSKKQIETKNGKQEPLFTLSSRERKRTKQQKGGHPIFQDHESWLQGHS